MDEDGLESLDIHIQKEVKSVAGFETGSIWFNIVIGKTLSE